MTRRLATPAGAALLVAVLLIALSPAWHRPESPFDEGFALAYGVRVLEGDLPHRDFVSFYGPGNPWLLAGTFAIGGVNQESERALGALYRVLIVLGIAGLALPAGRVTALVAAGLAIPLLLRLGFPAYAVYGALGLTLTALALLASARGAPADRGRRRAMAAGAGAGAVALLRPEMALALVVAALPLVARQPRRRLAWFGLGVLPAAVAWVVHLALVGPERVGRVLEDLGASVPGRRLPFDPLSADLNTRETSRLLIVMLVAAAVAVTLALLVRRRRPEAAGWRAALAFALLGLSLLPHAFSRLDYMHMVIPLIPAVAGLVAAVGSLWPRRHWLSPMAGAATLAVLLLVAPLSVRAFTKAYGNWLLGRVPHGSVAEVRVEDRGLRVDQATADDLQPVLDAAVREQRAGARTLFVGPGDLRRSNINEAALYYLLRDLDPASYYLELNPWTANRPGSGLAREIAAADLLILNRLHDSWDEPNASDRLGSDAPNRVVAERFCPVVRRGTFELLRRCR